MEAKNFKYEVKKFKIFLMFDENQMNTLDRVCISIIYVTLECRNE